MATTPTIAARATITLVSPSIRPLELVALLAAAVALLLELVVPGITDEVDPEDGVGVVLAPLAELLVALRRLSKEGNTTGGLAALQIPCAVVCVSC